VVAHGGQVGSYAPVDREFRPEDPV
jgi:hypothetical protein